MKILYAEDMPHTRWLTADQLEKLGHTVEAVENGRKIIERLESGEVYDALITDNNMPEMTGIDALRWLRDDERFKSLPVIVLTSDWTKKADVERLGGIFLEKGGSLNDLIAVLERVALMVARRKG